MNISYNWLKQYLDIDLGPEAVASMLTSIGLEVEAIETTDKIKGGLAGFVIGKVLTCEKHADADKLSVTTVDVGAEQLLNIVCGAPNVAAGQHVVVATVGATIHKGDESFSIRKTKIRGVISEGMICAEDELGIGKGHEGILVLPENTAIGQAADAYFDMEPETMFVIGLTPNRIDSASHFGVARELAAYIGKDHPVKITKPDVSAFAIDNRSFPVTVVIENTSSCPRYTGVSVCGVKVGPSPDWLQDRLRAIGLNPVNNVVDVTNFVLHEIGQPLHAFDADELADHQIVVKNLPDGTPFVTLDKTERKLWAEDLMICDGKKPVALAGVLGGLNSGVTSRTRNIFIESAYFHPVSVRRTSKRHGIYTDASFRFERGVDPSGTIFALKRCALLIQQVAGGVVSSDIVDVYPQPIEPAQVKVQFEHIDKLIGKSIHTKLIQSILLSLDFQILSEDNQGMLLQVPPCRVDVTREADVIEEILRIYGYNNVEISSSVKASLSHTPKPDKEKLVDMISEYLVANGFFEIMCNSLTSSSYYEGLKTFPADQLVTLLNPLSSELNALRQTMLFGGLETIQRNSNRQRPDLRLFEFGNVYQLLPATDQGNPLSKYNEQFMLALWVTGRKHDPSWNASGESTGFFEIKAFVENILVKLGFDVGKILAAPITGKDDIFSEGISYKAQSNLLAELVRTKSGKFELKNEVYFAVLHWDTLLSLRGDLKLTFRELLRFPEVRRDLALLLDRSVTFAQVRDLAHRTEGKLLKKVGIFDVYEGEQVAKGKKSYAVSFVLQDSQATLTNERIEKVMKRLMQAFSEELKAEIR